MKNFQNFTHKYQISKTLRFGLEPIGKTLSNLLKVIEEDTQRAESYKKAKSIIDDYHKNFINDSLSGYRLKYHSDNNLDSVEEFAYHYNGEGKNNPSRSKSLSDIQKKLREQIVKCFKGENNQTEQYVKYDNLFKINIFKEILNSNAVPEVDKQIIGEFAGFTTYFKGFHDNRKNMYSSESKSTAISYRLINQNLPIFLDNVQIFNKIAESSLRAELDKIFSNFQDDFKGSNIAHISEIFNPEHFSDFLTQNRIDLYNAIIGAKTTEDDNIHGLNVHINLYNQKQEKKNRLPLLQPLYKQILSDRVAISWLPESFASDNKVLESIKKFYEESLVPTLGNEDRPDSLEYLLSHLDSFNLDKIYIKYDDIKSLSKKLYGKWNTIRDSLYRHFEAENPIKKKKSEEKHKERIEKLINANNSFSLHFIMKCLRSNNQDDGLLLKYFKKEISPSETDSMVYTMREAYSKCADVLRRDYTTSKLSQDANAVSLIKDFMDASMAVYHFVLLLRGNLDEAEKDEIFYADFNKCLAEIENIIPLYNKVRNHITKKPYSQEKIKLNFNNATLLDGWDLNSESQYNGILLKKNGEYFLGIINKAFNKIFKDIKEYNGDGAFYEKMEYKFFNIRNFQHNIIEASNAQSKYSPSKQIIEMKKHKTYDVNAKNRYEYINYCKTAISKNEDWNRFNFRFLPADRYESFNSFTEDIQRQGYTVSFKKVSSQYIDNLVAEGKLYLFKIYNKDLSGHGKGTPNLHTLYWKMLFDERNLEDVVYKLDGGAEVFYRKASLHPDKPTHPANLPIQNKNKSNDKASSTFAYDLIKDKRYTLDKFHFHVPIIMNCKSLKGWDINKINKEVLSYLKDSENVHIIGIDRGERHLLYLTVIDLDGNIVEQRSLNEIVNHYKGKSYSVNYMALLEDKAGKIQEARKSWQEIENIKELKEGYLSIVIHEICDLIIRYNAIVVLENLNFGFIRSRLKVEKQVYQKFEKMLTDKLQYLVDKHKPVAEPGGLLNALQLTANKPAKAEQNGIIFYIPAWMTSKTDPTTGFVNLLNTKYETIDKAKEFFAKFDQIKYNQTEDRFEFSFDYKNFPHNVEGFKTQWTICSYGPRIKTFRNKDKNNNWDNKEIDLTEEFKALFSNYNVDLFSDIKQQIVSQKEKSFFEKMYELLSLTLQMRNSVSNTTTDYILSPVVNSKGDFFDSRKGNPELPQNADANGAYNIAKKGLWIVEQIKNAEDIQKVNLKMSQKEWLYYAQKHPIME